MEISSSNEIQPHLFCHHRTASKSITAAEDCTTKPIMIVDTYIPDIPPPKSGSIIDGCWLRSGNFYSTPNRRTCVSKGGHWQPSGCDGCYFKDSGKCISITTKEAKKMCEHYHLGNWSSAVVAQTVSAPVSAPCNHPSSIN